MEDQRRRVLELTLLAEKPTVSQTAVSSPKEEAYDPECSGSPGHRHCFAESSQFVTFQFTGEAVWNGSLRGMPSFISPRDPQKPLGATTKKDFIRKVSVW